jgi:replicative DNA helicase
MSKLNFSGNPSLPPQNMEAEAAILGGILLDPDAISRVIDKLRPEMFYLSDHGIIYDAAVVLHSQGKPTDLLSITSWLTDHDKLMRIGGRNKLATLTDSVVCAVNIDALAELVIEKYDRRQLIKTGNELIQLGHQTDLSIDEVKNIAEQKIYAVTQSGRKAIFTNANTIAAVNFNHTINVANGLIPPGIPCGFYDLDAMTAGFQRSDLIIVAGRPSMGKTAIAVNISKYIATQHNLPVAIFSLEMSKEQLVNRMQGADAKVPSIALKTGKLTKEQWDSLQLATRNISPNIHICDTGNVSVGVINSQCRSLASEQGQLGLVMIDYLQLMSDPRFDGKDNRVSELSYITRMLKQMARELHCPVIALSQLSRAVEARTNKRPMLSDLRESGSIEQEADIAMFLYRDEYYNSETMDKGLAEIIIAKHRNGPTGTVKLLFDAEYTQFKNMVQQTW